MTNETDVNSRIAESQGNIRENIETKQTFLFALFGHRLK